MRKLILIVSLLLFLSLITAFLVVKGKSSSQTRIIDENYEVTLRSISSDEYCEQMGGSQADREEYDDYHYFILRLVEKSKTQSSLFKELNSIEAIGGKINYLSNGITRDLTLITDSDTLQCSLSHWERTYNIRKDITINVAFKKTNEEELRKFVWNDNLISGIPIKFSL